MDYVLGIVMSYRTLRVRLWDLQVSRGSASGKPQGLRCLRIGTFEAPRQTFSGGSKVLVVGLGSGGLEVGFVAGFHVVPVMSVADLGSCAEPC